jgi:tetratricopeptide (TPR) repeat protein
LTLDGMAAAYTALGQLQEAEKAYRDILRLDPTLEDARRGLAVVLRRQGREEEARRVVREGIEADPDNPAALESALDNYLQAGDLQAAAGLLATYHRRGTLTPRLAYLYGRLLVQLDRLAAADSVLRPLSAVEALRGVETVLGDIAARQERLGDAKEHYRRAMARDPADCVPSVSLAMLQVQEMRAAGRAALEGEAAKRAGEMLDDAARRTGGDELRCNLLLGLAYMQLRRFEPALRHLEASHRIDPDNSQALFNMAMAHQELGHFETALDLSRRLLEREPDNAAALNFVGYVQAERGRDLEDSEALIRKALAKEPENGYYVDSLGWVLYQKGEYARAAVELERAVQLTEEQDAVILEHLGDAYFKMGRLDGAYRAYTQSKRIEPDNAAVTEKLERVQSRLGKP